MLDSGRARISRAQAIEKGAESTLFPVAAAVSGMVRRPAITSVLSGCLLARLRGQLQ